MSFQDYAKSLKSRLHLGKAGKKAAIGAIVAAAAVLASALFLIQPPKAEASLEIEVAEAGITETTAGDSASKGLICVHVGGLVNNPGVVYLEEGARVNDAIAAAGGVSPEGVLDSINLAAPVSDGDKVTVPGAVEAETPELASEGSSSVSSGKPQSPGNDDGKVNINTASPSELQTISGIGASKAQKIIDYRESNGRFESVDDLTKVSGIGEKTLESIRDSICV